MPVSNTFRTAPLPVLVTVLAALLPAACAPALPDALTPEEIDAVAAEVRAATEALDEAMAAHDAERVLSFYDASDDFVYVGVDQVRFGAEPLRRAVTMWHQRHPDVVTTAELVKVRVLDRDVAVAVLKGSSSDAGPLAWTRTLVRDVEDGRWRIVVEHEAWRQEAGPESYHGSMAPSGSPASPVGTH